MKTSLGRSHFGSGRGWPSGHDTLTSPVSWRTWRGFNPKLRSQRGGSPHSGIGSPHGWPVRSGGIKLRRSPCASQLGHSLPQRPTVGTHPCSSLLLPIGSTGGSDINKFFSRSKKLKKIEKKMNQLVYMVYGNDNQLCLLFFLWLKLTVYIFIKYFLGIKIPYIYISSFHESNY